jgi:N-acetylneuraminate synthase/N,N'-diacetyllegionaminate synthase
MSGRTLFLVPARGGSRRFPGKNVRHLAGIPLVGWAARIARVAATDDDLVVCSTDDPAIAAAAEAWDAALLDRPPELATDEATSLSVALHALEVLARAGHDIDLLALVQPTSPLTDPADLAGAVRLARDTGRSVTSVTPSHPAAWHHRRDDDGLLYALRSTGGGAEPLDPATHLLTGGFYVASPDALRRAGRFVEAGATLGVEVPPDRAIDVDTADDLVVAAARLRARPVPPFRVGAWEVGLDGVFVIAEAGVNHDGDVDVAHRLIDAAADAGASAVKFQTFVPEALASAGAPTAAYQRERVGADDQRAMLARLALPTEAWVALQAHARDRGIVFLSTPFDEASADLLDGLDVPAFKVGSGELTNLPFLAGLARRGRPLIVSTGMATMVEVAAAVDAIRATGERQLALLHCVSSYPAAPADANLAAMATMREAFGVQTGWSDHTPGIELPVAATALGAAIVEKHLTLDRGRQGPDHAMSLEPTEFAAMVAAIRSTSLAVGHGDKVPTAAEHEIAQVARRSLHWTRDLAPGTTIEAGHLAAQRPGTGISPARGSEFIGRITNHAVTAGTMVQDGDA